MVCRLRPVFLRNVCDADRFLPQHGAHLVKLFAREARLSATVGALITLLGVLDTCPLCCFGGLSLCLSGRGRAQ